MFLRFFPEAPQLFAKAALRARLARLGPSALSPAELSAAEETQRPASGGAQRRGKVWPNVEQFLVNECQ